MAPDLGNQIRGFGKLNLKGFRMDHRKLVKAAERWLITSKGCNPVFCEKGSRGCQEIPDAIGWTCEGSIVVECKTSKADFIANSKKTLTLGNERYFLMENSLYEQVKDIVPDGWGILNIYSADDLNWYARQERFKSSRKFESCLKSEIRYLRSRILAIQRYGQGE